MNKTNHMPTVMSREQSGDREEARDYFEEIFPGILYDEESDTYEWRGYKFDYFKSGHFYNMETGFTGKHSYTLIDIDDRRNWVWCNSDENWNSFLKWRERYDEEKKTGKSWVEKFLDLLGTKK